VAVDKAELENEYALLSMLVDSPGWKAYSEKWQHVLNECYMPLIAPESPARDWYAGLVTAYERMLEYPVKRMSDIEKLLKKQSVGS